MTYPNQINAKRNVAVLVGAQALLGSQLPMIFVVGGLAGKQLTPFICLATLPISMIVFGSMTTAPWLSHVMERQGRRVGFWIGAFAGALGALISILALSIENFWLFVGGAYFTGIYMSSQGFFRFAAADGVDDRFRAKAISYVMAGGLISALIGPQIVSGLTQSNPDASIARYIPIYWAVIGLNLAGILLISLLRQVQPGASQAVSGMQRSTAQMLKTPKILVAVICGAVSFALMNLVMTATPLAVVGCGFTEPDAANIVSAHVIAMYAPSFITGHMIARFGSSRITGTGLVILAVAGAVGLSGVELTQFFGALILLGVGWNFGFIGATTMLSEAHSPAERGRIQGVNDFIVFGSVTLASLASGGLFSCAGADAVDGWNAVNSAMVPFLIIAGGALIWLAFRSKSRA